jgi:hypothetical protein
MRAVEISHVTRGESNLWARPSTVSRNCIGTNGNDLAYEGERYVNFTATLQSIAGSNYQKPTVEEYDSADERLNEDSEDVEKSLPSFENPVINSAGSVGGRSRRTPSLPEYKASSTSHDGQSHIYRGLYPEDQDYDGIPVADPSLPELYVPDVDLESLTSTSTTKPKYPKNSKMHGFVIKEFAKRIPLGTFTSHRISSRQ